MTEQVDHTTALQAWKHERGATAKQIAELLTERTGDAVGVKTVERWLADSSKAYSLRCPGWVVFVLRCQC